MSINAGTISAIGYDSSASPDKGWLFCNGEAVSRTDYAQLFAAIGTAWGAGDGQTTFNLPDLRGYFMRGVDDGALRDPDLDRRHAAALGANAGGGLGTVQQCGTALPVSGQLATDMSATHVHNVPHLPNDSSWYQIAGSHYAQWNSGSTSTSSDGDHGHACGVNAGSGGDAESRCLNVYVDYVIYTGDTAPSPKRGATAVPPQGSYPLGTIMPFGAPVNEGALTESGWLYCNGNTVSRKNYADLFAAIGNAYGDGDGFSTFNLPDLRGYFQRGVSETSGNDPDAATRVAVQSGGNTGNSVGSGQGFATGCPVKAMQSQVAGDHSHSAPNIPTDNSSYAVAGSYQAIWNDGGANTAAGGAHSHQIASGGDAETRPLNASCHFIIKFAQV